MPHIIPKQRTRIIVLLVYVCLLFFVNYISFKSFIPQSGPKGLWFYTGFASILLGNLLITPLFTKPVDAISYSVIAGIAVLLVSDWEDWSQIEQSLFFITIAFIFFVLITSFITIFLKDSSKSSMQRIAITCRIISESLGNQRVVFSILILYSLVFFHRNSMGEFFPITLAWVVLIIVKPDVFIFKLWYKLKTIWIKKLPINIIGNVVAYQAPNIFLIRHTSDHQISFGSTILINDPVALPRLSLALDYVGRDEALLLRCIELNLSNLNISELKSACRIIPPNTASQINIQDICPNEKENIPILNNLTEFVGIVAPDTSLETLYFEVIHERDLEEGRLVEVDIKGSSVLYQIIDGSTKEEIVHKKNTFGYVRVKCKKIGKWDESQNKFLLVKWIPSLNTPVFLKTTSQYFPRENSIGHFPSTNYSVNINNINELVTHNTAILGILGIGKSMLAIELVERIFSNRIKVICLDLTNQYATELSEFNDAQIENDKIKRIQEAGKKDQDQWTENPDKGGSLLNLRNAIYQDLNNFLNKDNPQLLKIYNPSQLFATKQLGDPKSYKDGEEWRRVASLWEVSSVEITRIITEITLEICKDMMTEKARVCLVFEEAHSLVPEWGTVAFEGDKAATNGTARAILQGRKYGLGCLLITQRTANVTKSILNQCNTIFAMRTFDDTGKEFLSNYVGREYANILPSIHERHAVVFGKGSSCENPVLIRLNDQKDFRKIFREKHGLPNLADLYKTEIKISKEEIEKNEVIEINDEDEEIPF